MYDLLPLAALVIFGILYSIGHKEYLKKIPNPDINIESIKINS